MYPFPIETAQYLIRYCANFRYDENVMDKNIKL